MYVGITQYSQYQYNKNVQQFPKLELKLIRKSSLRDHFASPKTKPSTLCPTLYIHRGSWSSSVKGRGPCLTAWPKTSFSLFFGQTVPYSPVQGALPRPPLHLQWGASNPLVPGGRTSFLALSFGGGDKSKNLPENAAISSLSDSRQNMGGHFYCSCSLVAPIPPQS